MKVLKTVSAFIKNTTITGIQSTAATAHLGVVYIANGIEELEAMSIRRLTGESRLEIIKARRTNTILKREAHNKAASKMRENLKNFSQSTHKRTMDLVHEFQVFNKVHTEDTDFEPVK